MFYYAPSAANMGDLIAEEARRAGAENVHQSQNGVVFEGSDEVGYRFCYTSRIATRLLLGLFIDDDIQSDEELAEATAMLEWEKYLNPERTFKVTCSATGCRWINNSHYAALKVKDGICQRIKSLYNDERPNIDKENPDFGVYIQIEGNTVKWYAEFSGEDLFKRGYRDDKQTEALLKENLAAALLYRSEWKKSVNEDKPLALYDPFCGSGTIAIEAALIASDTAPGLIRKKGYAFEKLPFFNPEAFEKIKEEAKERREKALKEREISIYASDISKLAVEISKASALKAGVYDLIDFEVLDFLKLDEAPEDFGCLVMDPPYGERMKSQNIDELYLGIGEKLQNVFKGWKATILTGSSELLSNIDMKPERTNTLFNGPIQCQAAHYVIFTDAEKEAFIARAKEKRAARLSAPLSESQQIAYDKLKKNIDYIKPIMEREGVTCYRIYDADIPEFNAAIDIYENKWIVLSEYAAPDTIAPETAAARLDDLILATERATGIDLENTFIKQRTRGKNQYSRLASSNKFYLAKENGVKFYTNFSDYLDTGIFLDHRPVRAMIQSMAQDKRFLNLFSYTGTATLNAIKGGAVSTVSVDASNTYLAWLEQNLKLNGYSTTLGNFLYKDDAIDWLWATYDRFDLIFCDPPTRSVSTDRKSFDVQRDHVALINASMMHLAPGGVMIFSTNYRKFRLEDEIRDRYNVEDITEETIGEDFKWTGKKIHQCFLIRKKPKVKRPVSDIKIKVKRDNS